MKLITNFPEITDFFKKDSFNDEELRAFIDNIENNYSDKNLKKMALSLVKLEVLKYELELEKKEFIKPNYLFNFEFESIELISIKFQVSSNLIIQLLKQKGFTKTESDFLNKNEYIILEDFFKSRKNALNRKAKQERRYLKKRQKKVTKSLYNGIPVYQNIFQNGGIGKLIYIRKK